MKPTVKEAHAALTAVSQAHETLAEFVNATAARDEAVRGRLLALAASYPEAAKAAEQVLFLLDN